MTPNTIEFQTTSNTLMDGWVMRITADRRIEVNEDVDVNEAAKKVLEAMQLMLDNQKRTWIGLTSEEKIIMSRYDLEYAALIGEVERKLKEKNT
jgi:type III secretory pathway component EscV